MNTAEEEWHSPPRLESPSWLLGDLYVVGSEDALAVLLQLRPQLATV